MFRHADVVCLCLVCGPCLHYALFPSMNPNITKSFTGQYPIGAKIYKRLIRKRVAHPIKEHLFKVQADFQPGKSCTSQLLNIS